ncbi:EthD family reductase [Brevibacillus daliensis]|uniref:EthD family reductase n=1 Tax=Brevibacillus daliensis TaxID=2892995 RepID=UPI001E526BD3|nr:EthD family reductase [Brevibacillus daliensis]
MYKLVAVYKKPEDVEAFDRHYFEVHAPLAEKMPGLIKMEVSKVVGAPGGESNLHLIAEMYFDSKEAVLEALSSAEGRAAGKDLMGFAGKVVAMHIAEVLE